MVKKQNTPQVIHLVLDDAGKAVFRVEVQRLSCNVQSLYVNPAQ